MSKLQAERGLLQELLDEEMRISGEIGTINGEIEKYENLIIG